MTLEKCKICGSEAEFHPINKIYVGCSNPDCLLHAPSINRDKWNKAMKPSNEN